MVDIADIESGNVKMGAIQYSTDANILFGLNDHVTEGIQDEAALLNISSHMEFTRGSTYTGKALELAVEQLQDHGREDANPFIFLFTDGKPSDIEDTIDKAKQAHALKFRVFVIAVNIDEAEEQDIIDDIASHPAKLNVLYLDDFSKLEEFYKSVYLLFCRGNNHRFIKRKIYISFSLKLVKLL